ncbi:MAG: PHP domain-containing protein [Lawsonibacter sp.]|nr:PHP domain-containing protein [Lawsonibacter sp.]
MIYKADLHTHSTASDGQYAPAELAELVKKRGAQVWALTDHDSVDGVMEAQAASDQRNLRMLRGVELSADDYLNLHILGYGFSAPALQEWLNSLKGGRNDRKYRIRDFLRTKGLEIPLDEVDEEAAGGSIGRPHFAMVMLRHGYVSTRKEAFDRYLDTPEFQEIEKGTKPSARECVERIKAAGGKVSLAHPYQIVLNEETLEELVKRLKGYGLDAIECYYPIHTPEQTAEYLSIAKKYGLHITGGSDFHGEKNKPDHPLAAWELELDWLL